MSVKSPPPVSTRFPPGTVEALDARAAVEGETRSALIVRYVSEGLEMEAYPGIVFRWGPAGRRPGLAFGPDVWEVVAVQESFANFARTAEWLDLPGPAVSMAMRYYSGHRAEIDAWIARAHESAEASDRVRRARQAAS